MLSRSTCTMKVLCIILTVVFSSALAKRPFHCNVSTNCSVPFLSVLVLECPGDGPVTWQHTIYNVAASRYHNVTICDDSTNRTCIVRGYEGSLSYDDSGLYYCNETETNASWRANVTIQAPPKITSVFNTPNTPNTPNVCSGPYRSKCTTSPASYQSEIFNLIVNYTSVDPNIDVQWFLNDTMPLNCSTLSESHHCVGIYTTSTYTTIELFPKGPYSLNGVYSARIRNDYGKNSSLTQVYQMCPDSPQGDVSPENVNVTATFGESLPEELTRACRAAYSPSARRYLCFTNNPNVTFDEIANSIDCAWCAVDSDIPGNCYQLENNNHFSVTASVGSCPWIVNLSIKSRENYTVNYNDSGRIFCSYPDRHSSHGYKLYTTVHLNVVPKPPPNLLSVIIAVPAGSTVLLVVVTLLVVIGVLSYKYRSVRRARLGRVRQRKRVEAERALLVQEEGTAPISVTVSSNRMPPRRTYQTFPSSVDSNPGINTDVQSDLPGDLPVQSRGNQQEINI